MLSQLLYLIKLGLVEFVIFSVVYRTIGPQHIDTQHNGTQHNDTHHTDTQYININMKPSLIALSIQCHNATWNLNVFISIII